jgi:hypothetical protein
MSTNFLANIRGKFIVDISGQPAKDAKAPAVRMDMSVPGR